MFKFKLKFKINDKKLLMFVVTLFFIIEELVK